MTVLPRQYRRSDRPSGSVRGRRSRLLIHSLPAFGHVYPLMPLALAARDAGHEVVFAVADPFVGRLRALGFEAHPAGRSIAGARDELFAGGTVPRDPSGRPDERAGAVLFVDVLARRSAADLAPLLRGLRPDLVVYEEMALGAPVAAAAAGIPSVSHGIVAERSTTVVRSTYGRGLVDDVLAGVGLPPQDMVDADLYLDPFPASLANPLPGAHPDRLAIRPVPWSEPVRATTPWFTGRRPVVYVTLGTVVAQAPALRAAVEAVAALDVDVLVALGPVDPGSMGGLPSRVRVEPFVDQAAVLPLVDAVVHHGGSGTLLGAASHGLPQLLLPLGADQFHNADVLPASGVGIVLEPASATGASIGDAVQRLLTDPGFRVAARRVHRDIAEMPEPGEVLERMLRSAAVA